MGSKLKWLKRFFASRARACVAIRHQRRGLEIYGRAEQNHMKLKWCFGSLTICKSSPSISWTPTGSQYYNLHLLQSVQLVDCYIGHIVLKANNILRFGEQSSNPIVFSLEMVPCILWSSPRYSSIGRKSKTILKILQCTGHSIGKKVLWWSWLRGTMMTIVIMTPARAFAIWWIQIAAPAFLPLRADSSRLRIISAPIHHKSSHNFNQRLDHARKTVPGGVVAHFSETKWI